MRTPDPDAAFAALRVAEPDVMDRDELASVAEQIAALKAWVDAVKVRVTRRQRADWPSKVVARHRVICWLGRAASPARTRGLPMIDVLVNSAGPRSRATSRRCRLAGRAALATNLFGR